MDSAAPSGLTRPGILKKVRKFAGKPAKRPAAKILQSVGAQTVVSYNNCTRGGPPPPTTFKQQQTVAKRSPAAVRATNCFRAQGTAATFADSRRTRAGADRHAKRSPTAVRETNCFRAQGTAAIHSAADSRRIRAGLGKNYTFVKAPFIKQQFRTLMLVGF